jgi:major vault protein
MSENTQKDLVLAINEYAYVLDETKGFVSCYVGPYKSSLSQSDKLVRFNPQTKKFDYCTYGEAKSLFVTAPENWYVILKNPTKDMKFPNTGTSNSLPDNLEVGRKVNVRGPVNFALYPGQMAKVVKGHALRSNQYLLARVYEADAANSNSGKALDAEGNEIEITEKYINGQILVIKGTEVSFYIPPTGIEVIPTNNGTDGYSREAVTLERLEYCILKDENGEKRYCHGAQVVFPKPTETFVTSPKGGFIFKAIELSKISGVYVKVIAEYEENGIKHPIGEELFITGNDKMIYYPRPEHAIISYDGKMLHHAIAIPKGEGRYIMNRLTGEISTIKGPAMYLPDPRKEVVVKRKLTSRECKLMYPNNIEAYEYNQSLTERTVEKANNKSVNLDNYASLSATSFTETLANLEAKASISRGTSYTKPRTITLDNKYDGVVSVDVWNGYAVNVISKNGDREVICGPQTILLDYDQTLGEIQMSTGNPKTTDHLIETVYLRHENNKVSDTISIETKDFVRADIKVSYCVNFKKEESDKWFNVENYIKYLCDRERSIIKREAKKYNIEDFYQNYSKIVRDLAINANSKEEGRYFPENGMIVTDCEVLFIKVEAEIARLLEDHQYDMISNSLKLTDAEKRVEIAEKLSLAESKEQELRHQQLMNEMELKRSRQLKELEIADEVARKEEASQKASKDAEKDLQQIITDIRAAECARYDKETETRDNRQRKEMEIEKLKQQAYADTVEQIMESITPGLVEALESKANADIFEGLAKGIAPYAMAKDESAADFVSTLLRGTTLENVVKNIKQD